MAVPPGRERRRPSGLKEVYAAIDYLIAYVITWLPDFLITTPYG
jgi:hypothetical protein